MSTILGAIFILPKEKIRQLQCLVFFAKSRMIEIQMFIDFRLEKFNYRHLMPWFHVLSKTKALLEQLRPIYEEPSWGSARVFDPFLGSWQFRTTVHHFWAITELPIYGCVMSKHTPGHLELRLIWKSIHLHACELVYNCSPPVRWGLLDFMSDSSPPPSPSPPSSPSSPSPPSPPSSSSSCPLSSSSINWDSLRSVWRAGPQLQLAFSQFSVACWTPTAILWVRCGVLDPNRDLMSLVWRAGPQPRSYEFSVACWTPTAILRVQCGVLDPNRDIASSVWRAGPQPRYCVFSVACWTPTAILWVQCGVPDLKYCVRKFVRKNDRRYVRKNDRRYVRKNDRRYVRRNVKRICQKICQKECQKICQKDVRKNVRRYVRKNVKRYVRKNGKRYVRKNVRR